jgi:putative NADPH-quinone reductase
MLGITHPGGIGLGEAVGFTGGQPAPLKGWMDKVLLPGFALTTDQVPAPLLTYIRGATVLTTTGTPDEYHRREYNNALVGVLCKGTLEFCGVSPVNWLNFGDTGFASRAEHAGWLKKVEQYARHLGVEFPPRAF